ncbi:Holliday junction DNA helicase RuvA [Boudabousia liubingyangii]|uniref:Holliday junction branch migration complex subunit RuvA n=1 Tax=Boudabousia liubingyangii TaxID=1921764 RepID=A0A1Q5PNQ9_9ACTO|nr:Holliday junction branch migration protein RuvA [Boudabousia liubingyangii]OKL47721.1 Holliday junction DNA helicase RuvA [Boudabousia liubingyangii]OKL49147.1 Holliday junction DNA helicase RuvA [Boudabousia liubingyangii]
MIASLTGLVRKVHLDRVIIEVNGIGYLVYAPATTLSGLFEGEVATLQTTLIVREDSLTLFGFTSEAEQLAFESLITINGIGPKLGIAILSVYDAAQLSQIAQENNEKALIKVPGIGKKGAQRIIIELKDKLAGIAPAAASTVSTLDSVNNPNAEQVVLALTQLGWQKHQAQSAVDKVLQSHPDATPELILRLALQVLGG